jgi:enoyl-CoA hydratase/carnithine racemase
MKIEYRGEVGILRMQAGKANAMSPSFLSLLDQKFDELQERPVTCLILTGDDKNFSAGLNLIELWEYDRIQLAQFMEQFAATFVRLIRLPFAVIAAINGNAVAGGAILAQLADYRIMARGDARIGVNEINVGIPFPQQALEIVKSRLPRSSYFDAIYRGLLFTPDEALKYGLIDEVCEPTDLEQRAFALAEELAAKNRVALTSIKHNLAAFDIERLERLGRIGNSEFIDIWFSDETRSRMGKIVESLKAKKRA